MVTWDAQARFTVEEALQFFERHVPHLDGNVLYTAPRKYDLEEFGDRWSNLPPDFVEKWVHLRILPEPMSRKVLCWICRYRICDILLQRIRRMMRRLVG